MEFVVPRSGCGLWISDAQLRRSAIPYVDYLRVGRDTPGEDLSRRLDLWTPLPQTGPYPDDGSGTYQDL
jgi:hypothetical protein